VDEGIRNEIIKKAKKELINVRYFYLNFILKCNIIYNMKKCPPGVLCVENISIAFIILFIFIVGYLIYANTSKSVNPSEKIVIKETNRENYGLNWFSGWLPSWPYNNLPMLATPY